MTRTLGKESFDITAGVSQGSVLGPLMWNVMYDGVLRLQLSAGCDVVGFGYDVALVEVKREEVERSGTKPLRY